MDDNIKDYLTFKKMITPLIIQIMFWIGVIFTVLGGLVTMFGASFFGGLMMIIMGPIFIRIFTELIMVTFKMNEGIQTIAKKDTTFD